MLKHTLSPITIKLGPSGWIFVELPYSTERVLKIKTITGRKWQEDLHCWAIPRTARTVERLKALFSGDQIIVDPQLFKKKTKPAGWQPAIRVSPGPPSDLVFTFTNILQQEAYSPHTIKIYTFHTRRFLKAFKKTPSDLQAEDIKAYLHQLQTHNTQTYTNQAIRALKALCRLALHKSPEFLGRAFPPRAKNNNTPTN
ncbi:MAG: hypothetical protein ACI8V2_004871 [Candidatus Latescibacterota bacterium]|jgi:hypothetical protein